VGRGDRVSIRGSLPADAKLGRLSIFASENGAKFSPYVLHVADMMAVNGRPVLMTPLSLRLVDVQPEREISFVADIDGFIRTMQEVDTPDEPKAKVKASRTINPDLSWTEWIKRKLTAWQMPTHSFVRPKSLMKTMGRAADTASE